MVKVVAVAVAVDQVGEEVERRAGHLAAQQQVEAPAAVRQRDHRQEAALHPTDPRAVRFPAAIRQVPSLEQAMVRR